MFKRITPTKNDSMRHERPRIAIFSLKGAAKSRKYSVIPFQYIHENIIFSLEVSVMDRDHVLWLN